MKRVFLVAFIVALLAGRSWAQSYPTCPHTGSPTSCTLTIHVTSSATPVFAKLGARQYLLLQNTGYNASGVATTYPVFCAIGSSNNPIVGTNTIKLEPGWNYEPTQIVKPQNPFTIPSGDISCIAPLGDVWLTAEEE